MCSRFLIDFFVLQYNPSVSSGWLLLMSVSVSGLRNLNPPNLILRRDSTLLLWRLLFRDLPPSPVSETVRATENVLPILISGMSVLPGTLSVLVSLLAAESLLDFSCDLSGDLFHHLCRVNLSGTSRTSLSAQYPSGNHTHSNPGLGGRGGSTGCR